MRAMILSLWAAALPVAAQQTRQPALIVQKAPLIAEVSVTDDAAKLKLQKDLVPSPKVELTPFFKGGLMAPFGTPNVSYPTLLPSPFGLVGLRFGLTGPVEAMVVATQGVLQLKSQSPFGAASGDMTSPANSHKGRAGFDQKLSVSSVHADLGKKFSLGGAWNAAVFAAADGWLSKPMDPAAQYGAQARGETSAGFVALGRSGVQELTVTGAVQVDGARKSNWRNYEYESVPSGTAGVEYALGSPRALRVAAGAEGTVSRAEHALRPYTTLETGNLGLTLAGDLRQSRDPFYPTVRGAGVEVRYAISPTVTLDASGAFFNERYPMAPEATNRIRVMTGLTIELGGRVQARVAKAVADDGAARRFALERAKAVDDSLPGRDRQALFATLQKSPTLADFIAQLPSGGTDRILTTVSQVTDLIGAYNYNVLEEQNPSVNDIGEFYSRMRASALKGSKDPITVCIGSSQFAARLAEELGRRWGVDIVATAPTVRVPAGSGTGSGHAVAAIKTKEYGIVFVDWGRLTPTYTWDTREALRVYQALVGIPAFTHDITGGPDGRLVGTLFTEEGKIFVRELTAYGELPRPVLESLFNDAPQSAGRAIERYRLLLRSSSRR